ncbi:glycoside hydrolase family protein [Membranihabitans maritimus]|uniref:glycoside hydrolase family protein n=1 Tax=Membranihabitans maritimus TaxID=2904244 RepID=UPI001F30F6D7|nr:glycoside hydrolase family protein [Membranihabitans maritimus]
MENGIQLHQKKKYIIPVCFLFFSLYSSIGQSTDNLRLSNRLLPVSDKNVFRSHEYYNWGGSIIKGEDDLFHLFYSRWPKATKFTGWLVYSEVAHAVSDNPSGPWEYKETILKGRGKGFWDAITAHNPKVKYFEGKYYLYYISTNLGDNSDYSEEKLMETSLTGYSHENWKILRPNQRTGVAVSSSLSGPWQRSDHPLIEPSGPITTLTVNPAIDRGGDNRYYLIVKGDKPNEERFIRNQAIAIGEKPDGPFDMQPDPAIDYLDTEDMSLWYDSERSRFYGVFHAHSFIGKITSQDGIQWKKAKDYEIMPKEVSLENEGVLTPDRLERPFVYKDESDIRVLGLAAKDGDDSFIITIPVENN